jgi:hypothetical protein
LSFPYQTTFPPDRTALYHIIHIPTDLTNYLHTVSPPLKGIPQGEEGGAKKANDPSTAVVCNGAKAEKVLGIKYRSIDECAKDSE